MTHLNPKQAGLALGILFGGFHLVWSILVALSWGQPLMDFILWAHMVHVPYTVGPFDLTASLTLIVLTFVVGYAVGFVFAKVWNKVHKS